MNSEEFSQWCHQPSVPVVQSMTYNRKPLIMGVLNITPNSFSDGGLFLNPEQAYQRSQEMISQGVDMIDIGGESSQPGVAPISLDEELTRVIPIIERIRSSSDICISIDTYKAEVMEAAVKAGASMINDIQALTGHGALAVAAQLNVPVCLMHMQGVPTTMQQEPHYDDVITEINLFFSKRVDTCLQAGISPQHLILDPGFGFGKTVSHNLSLVRNLKEFQQHQLPLLLGVSRKSTIGALLKKSVESRITGGLAMAIFAALQGVSMLRTHDIDETYQVLQIIDAIMQ